MAFWLYNLAGVTKLIIIGLSHAQTFTLLILKVLKSYKLHN